MICEIITVSTYADTTELQTQHWHVSRAVPSADIS